MTLHLSTQYAAVKGEDPAFLADLFIVSAVELGPDAAAKSPPWRWPPWTPPSVRAAGNSTPMWARPRSTRNCVPAAPLW